MTEVAIAPATEQAPKAEPLPARYASMHYLHMRVDTLADLPGQGTILVRHPVDGVFGEHDLAKVQHKALVRAIEEGRVYVFWGHRYLEFEELGPEWPRQSSTRQKLDPHRRRLYNGRRPQHHDTDAD